MFLFQRKDNINLKHCSRELKYSLTNWLHSLFSLLRRHRPRASQLHLGLSCISLLKPQMAFHSQILYLLRNARPKEYNQDSTNILAFKGRIRAAATLWVFLQPLHQHSGICTVPDLQPHSSTWHMLRESKGPLQCPLQAWQSCKKAVLSSYKWGKKTHRLRSQVKWWCFSWEQHVQQTHHPPQDKVPRVSALNPAV